MRKLTSQWVRRSLRTSEELINRQQQDRSDREAARTEAKNKKIADAVIKIQRRIDSAVRTKNASTLADIYASDKLRQISNALSREDAIALLGRDAIWRAFGLIDSDGRYLIREGARGILSDMAIGRKIPTTKPGLNYELAPLPWPPELGGGVAKTRW
jgi:hypothetical protein